MPEATIKAVKELPEVLTMAQVQQFLGLSKPKAYELAHTEGFPVVRFGRGYPCAPTGTHAMAGRAERRVAMAQTILFQDLLALDLITLRLTLRAVRNGLPVDLALEALELALDG